MPISDDDLQGLRPGPPIAGRSIQHDATRGCWVIDQILVVCTPPEDVCLRLLLEHSDRCVSFPQFAEALAEQTPLDEPGKSRLQHTISNLRPKIWVTGMDILSLRGTGYLLLSQVQGETPPSAGTHIEGKAGHTHAGTS